MTATEQVLRDFLKATPRVALADLPTPVERLTKMEKTLGVGELWCKRDDLTGTLYGGNKVRKLEFLFGDARALGQKRAWTVGAIGSHHVLATALYGQKLGFEIHALQFPQPVTQHVRNNLLALSTTGAKLHLVGKEKLPFKVIEQHVKAFFNKGEGSSYLIPGGGSSKIGALGYVLAAFELARDIAENRCPEPDYIFVPAGTCGTLAGLWCGLQLAGLKSRLIGVRVIDSILCNTPLIRKLVMGITKILKSRGIDQEPLKIARYKWILLHSEFGKGYGVEKPEATALARELSEAEKISLEPTYTAKAFHGIFSNRNKFDLKQKKVLFWNTFSSADLSDLIKAGDNKLLPADYKGFFEDLK